ncbi:hypothetical protein EV199_0808 [Pseudobacter ginsenosidimutans]|uniref:Uncharacterized protein n=1 Tax=Pseudobacter ginsenosidimutans TaxID=661488 RepID=A0A4V2F1U1_9BACT|nr:hypothetical protein EV199_0808 [Pseudobacter ginsenosidimutans]
MYLFRTLNQLKFYEKDEIGFADSCRLHFYFRITSQYSTTLLLTARAIL